MTTASVVFAIVAAVSALPLLAILVIENAQWLLLGADGRHRALNEDGVCDPDRCRFCQYEMTEDE